MKHLASAVVLGLLISGGIVGTTAAATPSEQLITNLPSNALPISDYYNQNVYDRQDNKIGDVNDILLDREGKVNAVIIGVGGFLGAGEKNVAVPFNALQMTDKNGKHYLVIDTNKQALESAPGYSYDHSTGQWTPTKQG